MKNNLFYIEFDKNDGTIMSLMLLNDKDKMNWCADYGKWGKVHFEYYGGFYGNYKSKKKALELVEFSQSDNEANAIYTNGALQVTVNYQFDNKGYLVQRYVFKNLLYADLFLSEYNCSVEIPLNDNYTYADDCLIHNCNAHIWCGLNTAYINALKMGVSDNNLGIVAIKGSFNSYSILECESNKRGRILLNLTPVELTCNEEYEVVLKIFPYSTSEDFKQKATDTSQFISISAKHYTVFENEKINFTAIVGHSIVNARVYTEDGNIECSTKDNAVTVNYKPKRLGEIRFFIEIDGNITYADFIVKPCFEKIIENRIKFIVEKQQYHKEGSPLDGAFLIYDNKEKHMIFEDCVPDHNASRERLGMGLLIAKFLQKNPNQKFYDALMKYVQFIKREIYDSNTGYVYNTIGKPEKQIRLYNAPWVSMFFNEIYNLTKDKSYLFEVIKLFKVYYSIGGDKFYPNGISILSILKSLKKEHMDNEYNQLYSLFKKHVDNIVANGISYPKHEVNYEQTIVSPAATLVSEFAILTKDEYYLSNAKIHIDLLERFNGNQPSFRQNEIPIRYWDDYWFGKMMTMGDTFPHYWSCLTARAFDDYYLASGNIEYLEKAKECIRNCICLFSDDGTASSAYVYPYKIDGKYMQKYDDWANDQDCALYFAVETGLLNT